MSNINEFGSKCEIRYNEIYGRYVIALKNIKPGEIIILEKPAVVVPQWNSKLFCSNCFKVSETVCKKCEIFPLCLSCTDHNNFDCEFFQKIENFDKNFFLNNFNTFGPLKILLRMENSANNTDNEIWNKVMSMESHQNVRKETEIWKKHDNNIVKPIMKSELPKYFKNIQINAEIIQKICGILDTNSFEVRGPSSVTEENLFLSGLYYNTALLAHSCIPNTMVSVDDTFTMKIYATIAIKEGETVYSCYTNPLLGTIERQQSLKFGKYFECHCNRCEDPTELGSYFSAIACNKCRPNSNNSNNEGYILFHLNGHTWQCNKCSEIIENSQIQNILMRIQQEILEANNDLRKLESLIVKFTKILHPQHYLIFDLKQNIASILRSICLNTFFRPGKFVLKRKLELCEDILPILRILQPGISRLTAITLYEYFTPFVELAQRQYEDLEITKKEYLKKLNNAELILKEAVQMLLYEQIRSPEGILAKRALMELRELRESIKELLILND